MLHVNEVTYRIAGRTLLDGASIALPDGVKAGFVGRNGTGKTTLFKLVTGDIAPESGTIGLPRGVKIGQVAQEAPGTEQSLIEFVLQADTERAALMAEAETASDPHRIAEIQIRLADIGAHAAEARAGTILSGLGFDAEAQLRPCSAFSGGWRMRVALAAVLFSEPDLLLLDEPTNYLDLEGTMWLENYVARYPHTVFLISHDRDLLNRAVDMIVHLDQGKLVAYRGGYDSFDRQRREKQALQSKLKKKQDDQRKHLQAFVDRFKAKASKARQAQSRMKALEKMQPIAGIVDSDVTPFSFPPPARILAPPIIALDNVSVGYETDKPILKRLDLRIDTEDRIGLLGANGNGKSTFAKLLSGRLAPFSGTMRRADKLEIAFFAQHQLDDLQPAESAVQHVRMLMRDASEAQVRSRVGAMGFPTAKMDTPARDLSGGERARLLLGIATFRGANLLILDEPTNHLDIDSREALTQALNEYPGAVILISHDRHLIEASVDRLLLVANGGVENFEGDMDDYRSLIVQGSDSRSRSGGGESAKGPSAQERRRESAQRRAGLAPLRKRIKDIETLMEKLKKEIQRLDAALADPSLYSGAPTKAAFLSKDRADAVRKLGEQEETWLELSTRYEEEAAAVEAD
ncbi:ABC-F family ATP-binding cassette domain-containing protein [Kaistia dalseonensis]|uniref:ATP-binding cassette subfamily F protein 3 n=1 Tax=Kaistia dalseonensis TaxID=410840 RepID=A0ABU0H0D6_9HYPH|nr:ABC-F family ATP-binding cassette domain-containing protein [Kaistia dalseonensis]MCX5493216.1 ABC-F family ATP-binding cassette domain-containing protein [Kaistia dalseonensis]MDQ0435771.1 ATP-binding cassette subfamily F protein 3 [Kaistia dalseonensis]